MLTKGIYIFHKILSAERPTPSPVAAMPMPTHLPILHRSRAMPRKNLEVQYETYAGVDMCCEIYVWLSMVLIISIPPTK